MAVSCSIAAVAWSIKDVSLLAVGIPGLAAGHLYSWRRPEASIGRSLILLGFMVLTVFLGGDILLSGLSDRLLLSRYLVYGLVLGSFDLMRRRNVVASLILGTLLLVLISELALNLWFIAFLGVFIILALASVYTSRVETESAQVTLVGELNWSMGVKAWAGFTIAALLLATVVFLLMPRLASRQVTQASWLPSRLDLSLSSPAILPGRPGAEVAPGIFPSLENGEVPSVDEYASLGYTGSHADSVVMNVRSRISSYWRGLTLDEYDGRGWLPSPQIINLRKESRGEFSLPDSRPGLSEERVYWQAYYMLSDQPNAVFTGYNPGRIYLSGVDQAFLTRGTLYRALSLVPYLRPVLLRNDRVVSDDVFNLVLPSITERTAVLAKSIVRDAPTDYDKAARLERFLLDNYPYKLDIEPLPLGRDAADYFLFEQQAGYCANFATTMAVMARQTGLPARVAAGYLPGYIDPLTGAHVVRAGDAHAWVEIYFQKHGWVAFDPTPRADAAMGFTSGRNWLYFGLEDLTGITFAGLLSPLAGNLSSGSFISSLWFWIGLPAAAIVVILLALRFVRFRMKRRKKPLGYNLLDGESRKAVLALYDKMVMILTRKGLPPRETYQSPYEYAAKIYQQIPDGREIIERITHVANRAAYDPGPFIPPDNRELRQSLVVLRKVSAIPPPN